MKESLRTWVSFDALNGRWAPLRPSALQVDINFPYCGYHCIVISVIIVIMVILAISLTLYTP